MSKSNNVPRNSFVVAMTLRHKSGVMHDRRAPRGGSRNDFRDLLEDYDDEFDCDED
jgi:hypothetical protein